MNKSVRPRLWTVFSIVVFSLRPAERSVEFAGVWLHGSCLGLLPFLWESIQYL